MQVRFYNKTYSFNTKAELGKVLDDIYYYYQDLRKEIPRKYQQKIDNELQKLERDFEDTYRKVRNMESDLKNSKGENMNYYEKIIQEKRKERMNADKPFTKKQECLSTLDRIISLAQRKKSQVQQWRALDEDFDENYFLSMLKDALYELESL